MIDAFNITSRFLESSTLSNILMILADPNRLISFFKNGGHDMANTEHYIWCEGRSWLASRKLTVVGIELESCYLIVGRASVDIKQHCNSLMWYSCPQVQQVPAHEAWQVVCWQTAAISASQFCQSGNAAWSAGCLQNLARIGRL